MCSTLDVGCVTAPCSPHRSPYRGTHSPADPTRASLQGGSQSTPNTPKVSLQGGSQSTPNTPKVSPPPGARLRAESVTLQFVL